MTTDKEEQEERRRMIREQVSSNPDHARAQANDIGGGRFGALGNPTIVGATATPNYLGAPNWAPDPTGIEPPFPGDISEMQPTGEPHELKASVGKNDEFDWPA